MKSIHHVTLRVLVHATEGEDRVRSGLSLFVPDDVEVMATRSEGHYGNPIIILESKLSRSADINGFLGILRRLPAHDREHLWEELDERLDDDLNIHIRFDKQLAYEGEVELSVGSDSIDARLRIAAYPARRERAVEVAREALDEVLRF